MKRTICALLVVLACTTVYAQTTPGVPGVANAQATINASQLSSAIVQARTLPPRGALPAQLPVPGGPLPTQAPSYGGGVPPRSPAPTSSFQALSDDRTITPPDTNGAVGPNHLMVALNSEIRYQTRGGVNINRFPMPNFWAALGVTFPFDPKVQYDPYANRWIFCACAEPVSGQSSVLIGASATSDPTGVWQIYRIDADATNTLWADYPSLGFNKDWIVVSVNMYPISTGTFRSQIYAINKSTVYAGSPASYTLFTDATAVIVPASTYDNTLTSLYCLQVWNASAGTLRLTRISGAVGSETFTVVGFPTSALNWAFQAAGEIAPQLGTTDLIDQGDGRMMNVVYRNGSVWTTHNALLPTASPSRCSVQWWQVSTTATVQQCGRVDDPSGSTFYSFPSIAVNTNNDVLIGYTRFSASQYASGNYSFRYGSDAPNTMQSDAVLKAGVGTYFRPSGGSNRWGDYSSTVVDPVNDVDMWTIQEYAAGLVGTTDTWGTWWGKVHPPDVAPLFTSTAPLSATVGVQYSYSPSASGSPPPNITAMGLPAWLTFVGGLLTGTPGAGDVGTTGTITLTAANGTPPDATQGFSITVNPAPVPPQFTSAPITTAVVGQLYSYSPTATGTPTPSLSALNLPAWLSFTGTQLLGTPGAGDVGTTGQITLVAANGTAPDATQLFSIQVSMPNNPPVANAGPDFTANTNATVYLNGTSSTDPDSDPLSFNWTQVGGIAVILNNPNDPTPFIVTPATAAVLTFQVDVGDGRGGSSSDTVVVTVSVPGGSGKNKKSGGGGCSSDEGPWPNLWLIVEALALSCLALSHVRKRVRRRGTQAR